MCDDCIHFLLSHFHKGYTPSESTQLWLASDTGQSIEHFRSVVESLTNTEKLLEAYTNWLIEQKMKPKACSHDLIDDEDL